MPESIGTTRRVQRAETAHQPSQGCLGKGWTELEAQASTLAAVPCRTDKLWKRMPEHVASCSYHTSWSEIPVPVQGEKCKMLLHGKM